MGLWCCRGESSRAAATWVIGRRRLNLERTNQTAATEGWTNTSATSRTGTRDARGRAGAAVDGAGDASRPRHRLPPRVSVA
jgi:hypothetical protein